MTVIPGKGGQAYIESVSEKIQIAKNLFPTKDIEVDGGIKADNAYIPINAGANILVSGTGIFNQPDYIQIIKKMKNAIVIGSDHAGYDLKEAIKLWLHKKKIAYIDVGTYNKDSCDYPVYAKLVADAIKKDETKKGILICKTGVGMSIVANRYPNVRASVVTSIERAQLAKEHNNTNVLCLGAIDTTPQQAIEYVNMWLTTFYEQRHQRRLDLF